MGALSRRKGAAGERELATLLTDALGEKIRRKLGQARDGGDDIEVAGPFVSECKRRARIGHVYDWMAQAEFATPEGYHMPVVMMRADGQDWLVLMRFLDWARLAREEISDARNTNTDAGDLVRPDGDDRLADAGRRDGGGA